MKRKRLFSVSEINWPRVIYFSTDFLFSFFLSLSLLFFLLFKHRESFLSMEREREKRWRAINSSLAIFWIDSFHKRCPDLSINPGGEIDDYMYKGYEQLGWTRYAKIISDKKDRENFHFARKIEGCAAHREIRHFSLFLSLSPCSRTNFQYFLQCCTIPLRYVEIVGC